MRSSITKLLMLLKNEMLLNSVNELIMEMPR